MQIPRGLAIYELRAKRKRKHVLVFRQVVDEYSGFVLTLRDDLAQRELCRWYVRRRGERWAPVGDWFSYDPLRKNLWSK